MELDGLQEVTLLGLERVVQELLNVGTHSGCREESSAGRSFVLSQSEGLAQINAHIAGFRFGRNIPTEILEAMIASLPIDDLLVRNCAVVS